MLLLLQNQTLITDKNHALEERFDCATRRINGLKLTIQEKEAQIEASERKMEGLGNLSVCVTNLQYQLESATKRIEELELTIREKEGEIVVCETKIEQLEKFAVGVGHLQKVIALEADLGRKFKILSSGEYAKDEDVQEWNNFTDSFLKEIDSVPYIKILKNGIKAYRDKILSRSYPNRFLSLVSEFPPNVAFDTHFGTFFKIHIPYHTKWVELNKSPSAAAFIQIAQKDVCGLRTTEHVTSYVESDYLQIYFNRRFMYQIMLLPHFDDSLLLRMTLGRRFLIGSEYLKQGHVIFFVV